MMAEAAGIFGLMSTAFQRSDAAMSAIDLNRMSGSSFEGMKLHRQHVSALGG
jgi:hypothetical protein